MGALYLWLFFKYREQGRNRVWLYAIPVAHAVWTNLHGGYVQGLAMVLTFALGELLIWARARHLGIGEEKTIPGRDVGLLWLLAPACVVASLVNPYGYRLLLFPFHLTGMEVFMQSIYEWQPPYHASYNRSTMFFFYLIHVVWLSVAFFLAQRDRKRARGGTEALAVPNIILIVAVALLILLTIALGVLQDRPGTASEREEHSLLIRNLLFSVFAVFAIYTLVNLRYADFTLAGLFLLFFLMSLRHNRAVTDAAMGTFVILTASMSATLDGLRRRPVKRPSRAARRAAARAKAAEERPEPRIETWRDRSSPRAVLVGSFLLLGVSLHATFDGYYFDFKGASRERGFGIASNMPVCAVDFVERKQITGNAFVSYPFASMLIHRMHPRVKVNMDSRNDVYGETLYQEYWDALRSPEQMKSYLERHPIDFFMLSYGDRSPKVFKALEATGDWVPVYYDNRAFILVRNAPRHRDLINREAFRVLRPGAIGSTVVSSESGAQLLEESERAIRNCPTSTVGHFYKSKALQYLGRYEEALTATGKILEKDPENYQAYTEMGQIYTRMNLPDKAVEMYEEALRIRPDYKQALQLLRQIRGF
jgi:tetratricopeptide (TPR) repeat protein